jgi:acetylornithine/succinyldiaminopimelate/putrescine aminotransferase
MQTSEEPVLLDVQKADGIYLFDQNDRPIIDMISGIGVSNVGHGNKAIQEAIAHQAKRYLHTMVYGEFIQSPQIDLAQLIASQTEGDLSSVFFVNSGSEAIEGAMKLAKRYTKRSNIVAMKNAYHGSSHGAISLMSDSYFSSFYRPLVPGISFVNFNVEEDLQQIDESTAAVFIEPIQGEAGYLPASKKYLQALRDRCTDVGALLIFDEIQTGMGRTGAMFAYHNYGVVPDVLCSAKALGAGMPLGAFITRPEIGQTFKKNPVLGHISTFGGHPVSCAAAIAGIGQLIEQNLIVGVLAKEQQIRKLLVHPCIESISGTGLMLAVQLPDEPFLKAVVSLCLDDGLMIDWFLYADSKLRISPPLIITKEQIDIACSIILRAIQKVSKRRNQI